MGLDMNLYKKIYIGAKYGSCQGVVEIKRHDRPVKINFDRISTITEDVGYWRKANQIHNWFVENVQEGNDDCKDYYVSIEQLGELAELCEKVLKDPTLSAELLPTQSGFFYGGTDYDEYYFQDLEETLKILKPILSDENTDSYYYTSSW